MGFWRRFRCETQWFDSEARRGNDAVDTFLDLVAEHDTALRCYTIMANDRMLRLVSEAERRSCPSSARCGV